MGWEAKSEAFLEGILENQILETYGGHFFCFVSVFEDGLTSGTCSLPSRFLAIPVPCHPGALPSRCLAIKVTGAAGAQSAAQMVTVPRHWVSGYLDAVEISASSLASVGVDGWAYG